MTGTESMQFRYYPADRLMIESIASRLSSAQNAFRMWLMEYTINNGAPYNINNDAGNEPRDMPALVHGLARKRAIVLDANGNVNFIYPVSALPTHHRVHLEDGRRFSATCAIDALGAAFTFRISPWNPGAANVASRFMSRSRMDESQTTTPTPLMFFTWISTRRTTGPETAETS